MKKNFDKICWFAKFVPTKTDFGPWCLRKLISVKVPTDKVYAFCSDLSSYLLLVAILGLYFNGIIMSLAFCLILTQLQVKCGDER